MEGILRIFEKHHLTYLHKRGIVSRMNRVSVVRDNPIQGIGDFSPVLPIAFQVKSRLELDGFVELRVEQTLLGEPLEVEY
jgi:hypothetical protein